MPLEKVKNRSNSFPPTYLVQEITPVKQSPCIARRIPATPSKGLQRKRNREHGRDRDSSIAGTTEQVLFPLPAIDGSMMSLILELSEYNDDSNIRIISITWHQSLFNIIPFQASQANSRVKDFQDLTKSQEGDGRKIPCRSNMRLKPKPLNGSPQRPKVLSFSFALSPVLESWWVEKQGTMSLRMEQGVWSDYLVPQSINRISIISEHPTILFTRN